MKATMKGKITKMGPSDRRGTADPVVEGAGIGNGGRRHDRRMTAVDLRVLGAFETVTGVSSVLEAVLTLHMDEAHAEKLKYGQVLRFTLDTEAER